jgi:hypothetical protein
MKPACVPRLWTAPLAAAALAALAAGQPGSLEEVRPYLRTVRDTNGTVALEVALRRLEPVRGRGPALWLAAVTHLGTSNYYAQLQQFLDAQPLVLYEAVRHNPDEPPGPREGYSLQADLARVLGLTFQLDAIRYDRPHFKNSDLSFDDLARLFAVHTNRPPAAAPDASGAAPTAGAVEFGALAQALSGEGLFGGLARLGVSVLAASPRLQAATKVAMIEMLGQLPNDLTQIEGLPPGLQRLMRVLIEERNEAVVRDARAALARRPPPAAVAVFYGAGHMADLEYRLCRGLGYQPAEDRWLTAFAVDPRAVGISQFELDFTARLVRAQLRGLQRRPPDHSTNAPIAPAAAVTPAP